MVNPSLIYYSGLVLFMESNYEKGGSLCWYFGTLFYSFLSGKLQKIILTGIATWV